VSDSTPNVIGSVWIKIALASRSCCRRHDYLYRPMYRRVAPYWNQLIAFDLAVPTPATR
jgi:hypothetical protein